MTVHAAADLTNAIIEVLETGGLVVGDGIKPDAGGWQGSPGYSQFIGYVDIHPVPGGSSNGTMDDPFLFVDSDYILRSFGANRAQCETVNDQVRALMLAATFTVPGRAVKLARPDVEPGAVRDDTVQPPVWMAPARWRLFTA